MIIFINTVMFVDSISLHYSYHALYRNKGGWNRLNSESMGKARHKLSTSVASSAAKFRVLHYSASQNILTRIIDQPAD